jgi:hypothetical protein
MRLKPGEPLIVVTYGIPDVQDTQYELLGHERLASVVKGFSKIEQARSKFFGSTPPNDGWTLVLQAPQRSRRCAQHSAAA